MEQNGEMYFNDVSKTHWAYESIKFLYDKKIISGNGDGMFSPDRYVTREEFVKMIVIACGLDISVEETRFTDVDTGSWYEGYVATAVKNNIVTGMSGDRFGVGLNISREDMSVIAVRAMEFLNKSPIRVREYNSFKDDGDISPYAVTSVKDLYEYGVVNGRDDGCFAPQACATRAEAAMIIHKIWEDIN